MINFFSKNLFAICGVFFIFATPLILNASLEITEIMYDLDEGSDSGREWIEVLNNGNSVVDLSTWKFYEAEKNHKINLFSGSESLEVGEYVIIADNPEKVLLDYPEFSGTIFDSYFSLKNTGELLILKDSDLNEVDRVDYNPEWGAQGDGNSLQKINGNWIAGDPSFGASNSSQSEDSGNNQDEDESYTSSENQDLSGGVWIIDNNNITANAGLDKQVVVGADSLYEGKALGTQSAPLDEAMFIWSFGDGSRKEGKKILYSYDYPGEYIVVLNVVSGKYSATDRIKVKALPADVIISQIKTGTNSFIELYNKSSFNLDLSWWRFKSANQYFTLPENTIILSGTKVIFSFKVTNLNIINKNDIALLYPNGTIATSYNETLESFSVSKVNESPKIIFSNKTNNVELIKETPREKDIILSDTKELKELAAVGVTDNSVKEFNVKQDKGVYGWLVGLFVLILVALFGVILAKKEDFGSEDIEIIE